MHFADMNCRPFDTPASPKRAFWPVLHTTELPLSQARLKWQHQTQHGADMTAKQKLSEMNARAAALYKADPKTMSAFRGLMTAAGR